jgi:hypothetical protein
MLLSMPRVTPAGESLQRPRPAFAWQALRLLLGLSRRIRLRLCLLLHRLFPTQRTPGAPVALIHPARNRFGLPGPTPMFHRT